MDHEKKSPHSNKLSLEPAKDLPRSSKGLTSKPDADAPAFTSAIDEFFASLQSGQYRPTQISGPISVSVESLQRLAAGADSEAAVEATAENTGSEPAGRVCGACGIENSEESKFCGACGISLLDSSTAIESGGDVALGTGAAPEAKGQHYYHHHYHHHYFAEAVQGNPAADARPTQGLRRESGPLSGVAPAGGEAAVRRFAQAWVLACNTRQLDDLVGLYAADASVLRPNSGAIRGAAAIREFFTAAIEAGLGEVEFEPLHVELLGDVAFEAGRCKMLVPAGPGKRREDRGKYLLVLKREANGTWKAVADSWSSDLTAAGETSVSRQGMQNSSGLLRTPRKSA